MKKFLTYISIISIVLLICGFTGFENASEDGEGFVFDINDLYDYQKQFKSEPLNVCSTNDAKTYMDYRMTNLIESRQYQFLRYECTVDKNTGFLYDKDGFIAVALGSYYGVIGDRFYFTLDSGVVLPLVKGEEKADIDTDSQGCYHTLDGSVIEFVIDDDYASAFFGTNSNGYVLDGNYNNYSLFNGGIAKVEKVLDEKNDKIVSFQIDNTVPTNIDIFNYASGY